MDPADMPTKRKHRFPWNRRRSQKYGEDTVVCASEPDHSSNPDIPGNLHVPPQHDVPSEPKIPPQPTQGPDVSAKPEVPVHHELPLRPKDPNGDATINPPEAKNDKKRFEDQSIAIAIDRSGSTWGATLAVETAFVGSICSLLSPRNESPVQVLPWNDTPGNVISMPKHSAALSNLGSTGGTDPRVLYSLDSYLGILKNSGIWFLLTDGEIDDHIVQDFAFRTAENEMHGTACVVVIFGSAADNRPANCDISVGVVIYAVTPNCLFLFFDLSTGILYNLQCKGCFKELLPSPDAQRMLNPYTQWSDLPTISINDLKRLEIPAPTKVSREEVALQGQLKVNLEHLYSNNVPEEDLGAIIKNDDNLKSIVIAEMTRGRGDKLQNWIQNQYKEMPTMSKERPDLGGKAQRAITDLLRCMRHGGSDKQLSKLREKLREAHKVNWEKFEKILNYHYEEEEETTEYNEKLHWASSLSHEMEESSMSGEVSYSAMHVSSHSWIPDEESDGEEPDQNDHGFNGRHPPGVPAPPPPLPPPQPAIPHVAATVIGKRTIHELFFPGFQKSTDSREPSFIGKCMLCESESILALLLKAPPKISTPNFPATGSHSALAFPLAMGNFAELDVISKFICCESCALYLVRTSASPFQETIVGALPLVPIAANEGAWLGVVTAALRGRFRSDDLPSLFVAMLDRMVSENARRPDDADGKSLFHDAAQWARTNLLESTQIPDSLSSSFISGMGRGPASTLFNSLLSDKSFFDAVSPANRDVFSLRYPLPGFAVIVRLLRDRGIPDAQLELLTFHRFLYHLTEAHSRNCETVGAETASSAIARLLVEPDMDVTLVLGQSIRTRLVTTISPESLMSKPWDLLDQTNFSVFQSLEYFDSVNKRAGPATAIYLHHLAKVAPKHGSPVDAFNAIKVLPSMRGVMSAPFSVNEHLAMKILLELRP